MMARGIIMSRVYLSHHHAPTLCACNGSLVDVRRLFPIWSRHITGRRAMCDACVANTHIA